MEVFGGLLATVSFVGIIVFFILAVVGLIKKNGKAKSRFMFTGISFALLIVSFVIIGSTGDTTTASNEPKEEVKLTPEEEAAIKAEAEAEAKAKAEKEAKEKSEKEAKKKAEAEAKAKEEAEAKAKAEAEAKAKAEEEARLAAEKKANATSIDYAHLKKNPDRYKGEYVSYTGQILQILEEDDYTNIRLAVTQDEWGWNVDDVIWIEFDGITDFVEEDIVTVYGEIYGDYSYTSQAGWEISVPGLLAESIE